MPGWNAGSTWAALERIANKIFTSIEKCVTKSVAVHWQSCCLTRWLYGKGQLADRIKFSQQSAGPYKPGLYGQKKARCPTVTLAKERSRDLWSNTMNAYWQIWLQNNNFKFPGLTSRSPDVSLNGKTGINTWQLFGHFLEKTLQGGRERSQAVLSWCWHTQDAVEGESLTAAKTPHKHLITLLFWSPQTGAKSGASLKNTSENCHSVCHFYLNICLFLWTVF